MSERLEDLEARLAKANAELDRLGRPLADDPAVARLSGRALKQAHRTTDRDLGRATQLHESVKLLGFLITVEKARIAESERRRLNRADVEGATRIRTRFGWQTVIRVNAKTVTVRSLLHGSWTDRVPFEQVQVAS